MTDPRAALAKSQGTAFESECRLVLEHDTDFTITRANFAVSALGIEVDFEVESTAGIRYWIEAKGSMLGTRPGLMRTDTLKKAIANAFLASTDPDSPPFLILTSHLPEEGSSGDAMLRTALASGVVTEVIRVSDIKQRKRLQELAYTEVLRCQNCHRRFSRRVTRGRKPHRCPSCR